MPEILQSKTAGQSLSSIWPEVPERHFDTEEVTGSNPVRPTRLTWYFLFLVRGIVKTCGSAATLFFPPAVLLTTLIFATVLAVAKSWGRIRGCRTPGVQGR